MKATHKVTVRKVERRNTKRLNRMTIEPNVSA